MTIKHLQKPTGMVFLLTTLLILASAPKARALDVTANSCSAVDIQAAATTVESAGGGTVIVPACSNGSNGSIWQNDEQVCIWSDNELRIIGQGQAQTYIKYADGATPTYTPSCTGNFIDGASPRSAMMQVWGPGFKELAHMTLSGAENTEGATILAVKGSDEYGNQPMTNIRVHHVSFKRGDGSFIYLCQNLDSVFLFDHLYIGNKAKAGAYGIRIHGNNDESTWVEPVEYGTNNGVFIEDSVFNGTYHPVAAHGSARYVVRHNTFTNHSSALEGHGPSYSFGCCGGQNYPCWQGVYRVEVYDNVFNAAGYSTYVRSGHWIITDNTYNDQGAYYGPIRIEIEGSSIGANCNAANDCPYGTTGNVETGCQTTTDCYQTPRDVYVWGNTFNNPMGDCVTGNDGLCLQIVDKSTGCLRENREYYARAPAPGDPRVTSYTKFTYPHPLQGTQQTCAELGGVDCCDNVDYVCPDTVYSGASDCSGACCSVSCVPETNPPTRSNSQPSANLTSGTTETTISLDTDEVANCKYALTSGISYPSMTNTFTSTDATTHSTLVTGLSDGNTYSYYVKCNDTKGNYNTDDFVISFGVSNPDLTPPIISNVVSTPSSNSATITWDTDESANSRVDYGLTTNYGLFEEDVTLKQSHSIILTNLNPETTYYYKITSVDASNNPASYNGQFTTTTFSGWQTPVSVISYCGQDGSNPAANFVDEDTSSLWHHWSSESHSIVLDMGEVSTITKIRLWHQQFGPRALADITGIYISENTTDWGTSLGSLSAVPNNDPTGWKEVDIVDKNGRYIRLVSGVVSSTYWREFDAHLSSITCIDNDNDGYDASSCGGDDCDDNNASINPGATEICGNNIDEDCNGSDLVCSGNLYYVDKDSIGGACSDTNPGTETQPWCTIQKAATTLIAGDTVYIKNGTYSERVTVQNSGSAGNYITFKAYPGHKPHITGDGTCNWDGVFNIASNSYIKVEDLELSRQNCYDSNSAGWIIYIASGSNIELTGLDVHHAGGQSEHIQVLGQSSYIKINNNTVRDGKCVAGIDFYTKGNGVGSESGRPQYITITNNNVYSINPTNDGCGIGAGIATERVDYAEVYNNTVKDSRMGLDIGCGKGNKIYNNTINGAPTGIAISGNEASSIYNNVIFGSSEEVFLSYDHEDHPLEIHARNKWYNNVAYNSYIPFQEYHKPSQGPNAESKDHEVYNNLFYNNTGKIILDHTTGIKFYNNTVYGSHGVSLQASSTNAVIKNNIISVNGSGSYAVQVDSTTYSTATLDYNNYQNRAGIYDVIDWNGIGYNENEVKNGTFFNNTSQGQHALAGDPKFVNVAIYDFHLQSLSPCIDAGVDMGLPYSGSAPDMGAFEYNTITINTPQNTWFNADSVPPGVDVDFYDGDDLDSAWYKVGSNGNWVTIFSGFSGTFYTTDFTVDSYAEGTNVIYFKVTDDAGNTYQPTTTDTLTIRVDVTPPTGTINIQ